MKTYTCKIVLSITNRPILCIINDFVNSKELKAIEDKIGGYEKYSKRKIGRKFKVTI